MAIINRAALKAQFRSGSVPTGQEYYNLIDSMLVKRDDAFFGKWQPGIVYRPGDVVIYEKAIFCCITEQEDPCGCDDKGKEKPGKTLDPSKKGFCSQLPPGKKGASDKDYDTSNWQLLELDIEDEDWGIIRASDGGMDIMYAKVFGKIGIGTQEPQARVHIHDESLKADFLFSPDNSAVPELQINNTSQVQDNLSISLADHKAKFETGSDGFLFRLPGIITGTDSNTGQPPVDASSQVFITSVNSKPAIGIGTLAPAAAIDLKEGLSKSLLLNPRNRLVPEILWSHHYDSKQVCLSVLANAQNAQLSTNAEKGFCFKSGVGEDCDSYIKDGNNDTGKTLVSILPDAKVGIGTGADDPKDALDIRDPENNRGNFLMSFRKSNPALAIVNLGQAGEANNYLTIGADNKKAIFISDSDDGFEFQRGNAYDKESDDVVDVNQGGHTLMKILNNGKVVIGKDFNYGDYEFDLLGNSQMLNMYIGTDEDSIKSNGPLTDMLSKVKKLKPISFYWKNEYAFSKDEQYGFLAHEVEEILPKLVKHSKEESRAIAFPNLVAVLVKAVQEQQDMIDKLKKYSDDLERRIEKLESHSKK